MSEEEDNREMEDMELEEDVGEDGEDAEFLLLMAVFDRDLPKMQELLQTWPNLDVNDDDAMALRSAVKRDFLEGAALLLQYGADVHIEDEVCLTAAIDNVNLEMVRLLINYGANIHIDDDYPILAAAKKGSPEIVGLLMAEGSGDLENALETAIVNGHIDVVRVLIEGVVTVDGNAARANLHYNNDQPLQDAIRMNNAEIVQLLLSFGADVDEPSVQNTINTAEAVGYTQLVEMIRGNNQGVAPVSAVGSQQAQARTNRVQRAREIEAKNEELRAIAIQEQKNSENKKQTWVQNQCTNEMTLYGDEIEEKDRDKIVVIFLGSENGKGECLTAEELIRIKDEEKVGIWDGPPSGTVLGQYAPGRRREDAFVFRLPWTGIWVTKEVLDEALKNINGFIILQNKRLESLGSSFGVSQLHGQWGGKWGYEELVDDNGRPYQKVKFFENGDFQPDERFEVWFL